MTRPTSPTLQIELVASEEAFLALLESVIKSIRKERNPDVRARLAHLEEQLMTALNDEAA